MPYLHVVIASGRPAQQKRSLIRALTDATERVLDVPRNDVYVYVCELSTQNLGDGGEEPEPTKVSNITMFLREGRHPKVRAALLEALTDAAEKTLVASRPNIQILLSEIPAANIGEGGVPMGPAKQPAWFIALLALGLFVFAAANCRAQLPEPDGGSTQRGVLPDRWATGGPKCMEMPEWQVHEYDPDTYLLRQSGCTDFEKPFIYLLFGGDEALLLDTGSRNGNLSPTLQRTIHRWLLRNSRASIPLVVVHTHEHGDHVAGDAQIKEMRDPSIPVTLIEATIDANKGFYHIAHWPEGIGSVDLGDRVIDAIPIPGHSEASIALYDRKTAILFTGDTLYPGRLYVHSYPDFVASVARLVQFTDGKPVVEILGNHIEQTRTPYLDYPVGTIYQPDEHELQLSRGSLLELKDALASQHGHPTRLALRDFTIWPSPTTAAERAAAESRFKETQQQQLTHMWDQAQH